MKWCGGYLSLLLCFHTGLLPAASVNTDSLEKIVPGMKEDTGKVNVQLQLADLLRNKNVKQAKYYCEGALTLSEKLRFEKGKATAFLILGTIISGLGDNSTALDYLRQARELFMIMGDKKSLVRTLNNTGIVFRNFGNYSEALRYYFESLKIADKLGDKKAQANTHTNIGIVYRLQGNYKGALEQYSVALKLRKELDDRQGIASTYGNIGNVYYNLNNNAEALRNQEMSLGMAVVIGDKRLQANAYNNIGNIYYNMRKMEEAVGYYQKTAALYEQLGDKSGLASFNINLGFVRIDLKQASEARRHIREALRLTLLINSKENMKDIYHGFYRLDTLEGHYTDALKHYKLYIAYRDSLVNEENTKKTVQAQMQYDFDKQQAADSIRNAEKLKQEGLKHEQEIAQQRLYTYGGAIGFVLMLVVAGVSFRAYRQKQKANAIISEQKQLVEEKQKEILDSIHYAKRIQHALLPSQGYIERCLKK